MNIFMLQCERDIPAKPLFFTDKKTAQKVLAQLRNDDPWEWDLYEYTLNQEKGE